MGNTIYVYKGGYVGSKVLRLIGGYLSIGGLRVSTPGELLETIDLDPPLGDR